MSNTYPDLDLTNFPDSMDSIYIMEDPSSSSDMNAILSFMDAMDRSDFAGAKQILQSNPRIQRMFFDAFKWNRHEEMIIAIERVWDGNVKEVIAKMIQQAGGGPDSILFSDGETLSEKAAGWDSLEATKANKSVITTLSLAAEAWTGSGPYYATATVSGVPADGAGVEVALSDAATDAEYEAAGAAMIWPTSTGWAANTIALVARGDKPGIALPITIRITG